LRKTLEDRAANLGLLPPVVEFRGAVSDLADAYREADIFVLTSASEGTPNVLLEASSSGLPVVATRVGGTNEVVQEGKTGFLIDSADEAGMAAAVLRLIGDEDLRLRMGAQGRRFVEENHSLPRLGQGMTDFYSNLLT
jgi:glycosyltransferase involved in cell wall biosynthesis